MTTKIVFLFDKIISGGGEILLMSLCENISDRFEIEVWNLGETNDIIAEEMRNIGISIRQIGNFNKYEKYRFAPVLPIIKLLDEENVDILHGYSAYTNVLARLVCLYPGTPIAIGQHHGILPRYSVPILSNVITGRFSNITITVSNTVKRAVYGEKNSIRRRISGNKISTIYNGIDLDFVGSCNLRDENEIRDELDIGPDKLLVANVGRLVEVKNQTCLIRAIQYMENQNTHFLIIGDGPLKESLKNQAKELGVEERIYFLGNKKREDCLNILRNCDLYITTSTYEGFGISLIEALYLKVPVIASDIPVFREVGSADSVTYIDPRDEKQVAENIDMLINNDGKRQKQRKNGRRLVEEKYSITTMVENYEQLYQSYT